MMRPGVPISTSTPSCELAALLLVVDAAEHDRERQAGVPANDGGILVDLHREFAGRRDDQRAHRGGRFAGCGRFVEQRLIQRDQEGGGLAGAGLRLAGDVAPGERDRQGLGLDRRAQGKSASTMPRMTSGCSGREA